jgi:Flp pilus assembly protein TadG
VNGRASHLAMKLRVAAAQGEEGGSLVEMALSCLILIPVLFGIVQLSIGLYCYHYAADAAREATRWAIVRGANCNGLFGAAYCSPTSGNGTGATSADIAQYVKSLGYPYSGSVATTVQWCAYGGAAPATWTTCYNTSPTTYNQPGNQVQVTVSYSYPLIIPFIKHNTISLSSVSSMTIVQ